MNSLLNFWFKNLATSETPCMLCKHKSRGEDLDSMFCKAFGGIPIPFSIIDGEVDHKTIFKGKLHQDSFKEFTQFNDIVFEFDEDLKAFNEYGLMEGFDKGKEVIKKFKKEGKIE